jgi:hypothetical protein
MKKKKLKKAMRPSLTRQMSMANKSGPVGDAASKEKKTNIESGDNAVADPETPSVSPSPPAGAPAEEKKKTKKKKKKKTTTKKKEGGNVVDDSEDAANQKAAKAAEKRRKVKTSLSRALTHFLSLFLSFFLAFSLPLSLSLHSFFEFCEIKKDRDACSQESGSERSKACGEKSAGEEEAERGKGRGRS